MTWYNQHRRQLQANSASTWHARVLELAFWHAAHRVLSPLPPRALATREVRRVAECAFEAILNTTSPAPHWERWASPGFETKGPQVGHKRTNSSGSDGGFMSEHDWNASESSSNREGDERTENSENTTSDEYAYSYVRGVQGARDPSEPATLVPSPPASDIAAKCLGLASRHDPEVAAEKFARELAGRTEGESRRPEAHAVIYGARYLHAREFVSSNGVASNPNVSSTEDSFDPDMAGAALHAAATTIRLLNPVSWAPSHRKSDLRHALCALLRGALASSAGARLPDKAPGDACATWADAVSECREDVKTWIKSKEKKHAAAGLPLLGALHAAEALCGSGKGGEGLHAFLDTTLLKALREGKHRAPAVDALRAVVEGIALPLPANGGPAPITPPLPEETRARLRTALAAAAAAVKRTSNAAPTDPPLITAVARALAATARVDPLLAADVTLDLLREAKVSDALAAGLAALPDIFALTALNAINPPGNDGRINTMEGLLCGMRDSQTDATLGWANRILALTRHDSGSSGSTAEMRAAALAAETASSLARELRKRLSGAARALQTARPTEDGAVTVAVALLRCAPFVMPEEWRGVASGEAVPPLCAHPHPVVRRAAAHAVRRIVVAVPAARDAIVQGVAAVMLRAPSASLAGAPGVRLEDADVAAGAAGALRDACAAWRRDVEAHRSKNTPPGPTFGALRPESAGLLLLCSPSARTRGVAAETLREIAALTSAMPRGVASVSGSVSLFSVVESCAGEMLLCALEGSEGFEEGIDGSMEAAQAAVAAAGGAAAVAQHVNGSAWTSALGVLAARCAASAPEVYTTARAQALQRVQLTMLQEGTRVKANAPRAPTDPNGDAFELWRNLACFVCAASPKDEGDARGASNQVNDEQHVGGVPDNPLLLPHGRLAGARATPLGARGSQASLFALLVPCLRQGGAQAAAAAAVLARVPPLAAPRLLAALAPLQAELAGGGSASGGGTPFDRRSADRELRAHLARLHLRLAASGAVEAATDVSSDANSYPNQSSPGENSSDDAEVSREAVAARLVAFVDGTLEYTRSTAAGVECGPDELARLQFAAAACTTACAPVISKLAPRVLDQTTRARWWERFSVLEQKAELASGESMVSLGGISNLSLNESRSATDTSVSGYPDEFDTRTSSRQQSRGGAGSIRSVGSFDSERDGSVGGRKMNGRGSGIFRQDSLGTLDARLVANTPYARWGGTGSVDKQMLGIKGLVNFSGGRDETSRPKRSDASSRSVDSDDRKKDDDVSVGGRSFRSFISPSPSGPGISFTLSGFSFDDPTKPHAMARAAREAMAALLYGPVFDEDARSPNGRVISWIERRLERERGVGTKCAARALRNYLTSNPTLAHTALDGCYNPHERVASAHVKALSDLYSSYVTEIGTSNNSNQNPQSPQKPSCPPAKLVALVLHKLVHPSGATRDDAMALLMAVTITELGAPEGDGYPQTLPELPDAYRAFQLVASADLAKRRPDIGEELLVEALERLMNDGAGSDVGTLKRVLASLAPWVRNVHLPHIAAAGRAERFLRALYFVTYKLVAAMPTEIETLWAGIGKSPRNVVPALRFLEIKGLEDVQSAAAMTLFCACAKRACLFLARAAPQQSVDQLVYAVSLRGLEVEYPPSTGSGYDRSDSDRHSNDGTVSVRSGFGGWRGGGGVVSKSNYSFDGGDSESDEESDNESERLRVSAPDLAIILLAEVAAEHDSAFRVHLPVLLHAVTATLAGSPEPTVRQHCRQLLLNLTHALAAKPLASLGSMPSLGSFSNASQNVMPNVNQFAHGTPSLGGGWKDEVSTWGDVTTPGSVPPQGMGPGHQRTYSSYGQLSAEGDLLTVSRTVATAGKAATAELQEMLARQGDGVDGTSVKTPTHTSQVNIGDSKWSSDQIARLVKLLPEALVFEPGLREQWADEARRWLLRAASFPLAAASARVLAALKVPLDADAADALLAAMCASAAAAEGGTVLRGLGSAYGGGFGDSQRKFGVDSQTKKTGNQQLISAKTSALAGTLTALLLDTLTEMFKLLDDELVVVENAHVFWGAAACLRTMHAPTYACAARLVAAIAQAWPLDDPSGAAVEILLAAAPREVGTPLSAVAPNVLFTGATEKRWRGAKTLAAAAAAAAAEAWLCGVGTPVKFAEIWTLPSPPRVPEPAMSLHDVTPLLVKGLARPNCAAHALRALASLVPVVGIDDAWGGERALVLVVAGLTPAVLASAAAAEDLDSADVATTPRTPATPAIPSTTNASRLSRLIPNVLSVGEGAAAGRWLAAGLRAASAASSRDVLVTASRKKRRVHSNGAADALAAAIESVLPSPSVSFAVPRGRRMCAPPPSDASTARGGIPQTPTPPALGGNAGLSLRVTRFAQTVAPSLYRFAAPAHAGAVAKVLVDIAVASRHTNGLHGPGDDVASVTATAVNAQAAAALALLVGFVARAADDVATKNALLEASGGGSTSASTFAPIASLLDGPLSTSALELLRRVAELGEGGDATGAASDKTRWGRVASLGSPSAMWNSVDANGGRAVDLMYGVMLSGRLDPSHATLPACLVGDSAER